MGFASFRMGHLKKPKKTKILPRAATPNPSCATGGFYKSPANGATIDSLKPLDIEWDTTCLDTDKVDIHLLAPWFHGDNTEMTLWPNIPFAQGKHTVNIKPKWWNSTASVSLQFAIVPAGIPPGSTMLPAGPLITATYTPPADGSIPPSADLTKPDTGDDAAIEAGMNKPISGGKTAAAVLLPLLFVGLAIFAYFRFQRRKATEKTRRFSQAIDKRMSTISTDWKSMSAAGAQAAIRSSMAVNRDSSASAFTFGAIRPMSSASNLVMESDAAGVPQMTQVRTGTGVGLRNPNPNAAAFAAERASRVSRVSFADTARPSGESRRTRAFHSAYVPPVPTRADVVSTATALSVYPDSEVEVRDEKVVKKDRTGTSTGSGSPTLSPRQTSGPLTLTPDDIRARIQGRVPSQEMRTEQEEEYDAVMPALSMMRTGLEPSTPTATSTSFPGSTSTQDEYLFTPLPTPPAPIHPSPYSPSSYAFNTTPASPATPGAALSPDDMLRAYAERKAAAAAASSGPPSAFNTPASPKAGKGRKLSLRASFGIKGLKGVMDRERAVSPSHGHGLDKGAISHPLPAASPATPTGGGAGGMAGVGARGVGAAGMAGVGVGVGGAAAYAIGEDDDEEMDYEDAYVGTAN
ncbi:hypothetical protein D9615_008578 [Tricholomella constricta]|uniref:Uncharacterized protein n=1 Tax=Tricholomella constricta TaxID=117010 RepID=A0A8H5H4B2_9AGAR|nr:hypothetical protein D9615_008578 [Tricholomella constricta]